MAGTQVLRLNAILAGLPSAEFQRLASHLEVVDVPLRKDVYKAGEPISEIFFPLDSIFSLVAVADGKIIVEVATIGREGMVGLPLFLGAATSPHPAFCQIGGKAARMTSSQFSDALAHNGSLHRALNRLTQAMMVQIAQNVVCNSTHSSRQRAARWLLMTHDRVGRDDFELTQEFLAQMLGVRRATVSEVAQWLQSKGMIRFVRGQITLMDRNALVETSCPCYSIVKAEFDSIAA
jgi:CRP-like cAMP-binding protein